MCTPTTFSLILLHMERKAYGWIMEYGSSVAVGLRRKVSKTVSGVSKAMYEVKSAKHFCLLYPEQFCSHLALMMKPVSNHHKRKQTHLSTGCIQCKPCSILTMILTIHVRTVIPRSCFDITLFEKEEYFIKLL